jgi:hypothetical protein
MNTASITKALMPRPVEDGCYSVRQMSASKVDSLIEGEGEKSVITE